MMYASFIIAGVVFVITVAASLLVMFAEGMSDNTSRSSEMRLQAVWVFFVGTGISVLMALSHYLVLHW
jgi:hypothetical protein